MVVFKPKRGRSVGVSKSHSCPNCGSVIESIYDGGVVTFTYQGRRYAVAGGTYESVEIVCPGCGGLLEFARDELEAGGVVYG